MQDNTNILFYARVSEYNSANNLLKNFDNNIRSFSFLGHEIENEKLVEAVFNESRTALEEFYLYGAGIDLADCINGNKKVLNFIKKENKDLELELFIYYDMVDGEPQISHMEMVFDYNPKSKKTIELEIPEEYNIYIFNAFEREIKDGAYNNEKRACYEYYEHSGFFQI